MRKVHYLLPARRRDAWYPERQRRRMQFPFTSLFSFTKPTRVQFLKIAPKFIHFFTGFVHSSNLRRPVGGVGEALEIMWNQVKLHILPARRNGVSKDEKCLRSRKQFTRLVKTCLPSSARQWVGRQAHVSAPPPRKKGFRFVLLFIYGRFKS